MLTKLTIKCYRLLVDVSIDIEPGHPIVFIGPNCSGKTTFLEVIDLLSEVASHGLPMALNRRGGFNWIRTYAAQDPLVVEATLTHPLDRPRGRLHYGFEIEPNGPFYHAVRREWLEQEEGEPASKTNLLSRLADSAQIRNHTTGRMDAVSVAPSDLCLSSVQQPAMYPALGHLKQRLASARTYVGFFSPPGWARDPRELVTSRGSAMIAPVTRLDRRGFDLVNALYHLQQSAEIWNELETTLRCEFPFVSRLVFPPDPAGGRIGLGWEDTRFRNQKFFAEQMSDGMLSFLGVLAACLAPDTPAAIGFDEPDAHVHPSAVKRLVHLLESTALRCPVLVTTHSDRLLDFLSDPAKSIYTCEPGPAGVSVHRLDESALAAWRDRYSISELRARGQLDSGNSES